MDTRWDGLTMTGTLPVGIYYAGQRHRAYTLRVSVVGDLLDAQEAHPSATVGLISLELYRRQLLGVGEIPAEQLTLELLRAELTEIDQAEIERADAALTKKLTLASHASSTSDASSMPSSAMATDSTRSVA